MDIKLMGVKPSGFDVFSANAPQQLEAQAARLPTSQAVKQVLESKDSQSTLNSDAQPKRDPKEISNAVEGLNKTLKSMQQSLQFSVDEDLGLTVVKLIDSETKEVIRQIPTEEILNIAKAIDKFQGLLIKDKA